MGRLQEYARPPSRVGPRDLDFVIRAAYEHDVYRREDSKDWLIECGVATRDEIEHTDVDTMVARKLWEMG